MLTHADVRSKKRRSEWEKKAHYYAPEDAESLLPEGDDIGPVTHLSRSTSAYWCMCLLPEGDDIGPASHLSLLLLALLAHTGACVCCQKAAISARSSTQISLLLVEEYNCFSSTLVQILTATAQERAHATRCTQRTRDTGRRPHYISDCRPLYAPICHYMSVLVLL
jgi:hypothetical protein